MNGESAKTLPLIPRSTLKIALKYGGIVGERYVRVLTSIDRGRVQSTLKQRYRQFVYREELLGYFLKEHDVKGFERSLAS